MIDFFILSSTFSNKDTKLWPVVSSHKRAFKYSSHDKDKFVVYAGPYSNKVAPFLLINVFKWFAASLNPEALKAMFLLLDI